MYLVTYAEGNPLGIITFFCGSIAYMNRHVYDVMSERIHVNLHSLADERDKTQDQRQPIAMATRTMKLINPDESKQNDTAIVTFAAARPHADITSYFVSELQVDKMRTYHANSILSFDHLNSGSGCVDSIGDIVRKGETIDLNSADPNDPLLIKNPGIYKWYAARTSKCGSNVVSMVGGMVMITFMHAAGTTSTNHGFGISLVREYFLKYKVKSDMDPLLLEKVAHCGIAYQDEDHIGAYTQVDDGVFTCPIRTSPLDKTVFVPTEFYDYNYMDGPPRQPADLSIDAYNNAQAKSKLQERVHNISLKAQLVIVTLADQIAEKAVGGSFDKIKGCETLSYSQVMGEYEDLEPFDKAKSEGVRLKILKINRKSALDIGSDDYIRLGQAIEFITSKFAQGEYTYQVCCDKLKDELRDKERVEAKKTRVFNITDFLDNILIKMALGDLVNRLKDDLFAGIAACGINPGSDVWRLWYRMFKGGKVAFADVKGFDDTATNLLLLVFWEIVRRAYSTVQARAFAMWAFSSCINGIRFSMGKGVVRNRGNTSGNWITTFMNTIVNCIYFCVVTVIVVREKYGILDSRLILQQLMLKLYSDDNLVRNLKFDVLTSEYALGFEKHLKIVLTNTDKGEIDDTEFTIDDAEFISRRFVLRNGLVYCPLAYESLISQIYYVRMPKNADRNYFEHQVQTNITNVCRELAEYPRDKADTILSSLMSFICLHKLPYVIDPDYVTNAEIGKLSC
jgi:hypothetical protein